MTIIYVIKVSIAHLDGIVWKVGKTRGIMTDRTRYTKDMIQCDYKPTFDIFSIGVQGDGRFHEQAMQTAFSGIFAPIKTKETTQTEYYSPYVIDDYGKPLLRKYTDNGIEDALELLEHTSKGNANILGQYLSTVITLYAPCRKEPFEPAYCVRRYDTIEVDLKSHDGTGG